LTTAARCTLALALVAFLAAPALAQVGMDFDEEFAEEFGSKPAPDKAPVIPMNPQDPTWDAWRLERENLMEGREPGPIDVQRTPFGMDWQGIPTFFHQRIALTPEDLKAGKVDVAILGAHTDMGTGMRGAAHGPRAFRACCPYGGWGDVSTPHMGAMLDPFHELTVVDYGDAPNDMLSTERTVHAVRKMVRQVASVQHEDGSRVIPIVIGGDHSLMYPDAAALADVYGKGNVGVVHFDSHYDAGKYFFGHLIGHGMPVYRLLKEGHVPGPNFIQVALRGYYPDKETFEWLREQGLRYHTMAEIERFGFDKVMEAVLREANDGPEYIFVSFDIDALDPAYMPGTGTPEPGGLTTREAFPIVRRLCAESNVVGFELVELLPLADPGYTTVMNANRIVRECLTGIAMRKKGITEKHYLSPLTVDDGRD
jgi:agmatinase